MQLSSVYKSVKNPSSLAIKACAYGAYSARQPVLIVHSQRTPHSYVPALTAYLHSQRACTHSIPVLIAYISLYFLYFKGEGGE
jgi:hypothetical protein